VRRFANFVCEVFAFRRVKKLDLLLTVFLTILTGMFATWLVNYLIVFYPQQIPAGLESANRAIRDSEGPLLYSFLFGVCIFAPIVEELFFRGFLWWVLEKLLSARLAFMITTVLFAIAHLDILHVIAVFPLGLLFGFLRLKTKSLWAPLLAHVLNNTLASINMVL
jgi:membrane protease YdiL (CAAX protease family)